MLLKFKFLYKYNNFKLVINSNNISMIMIYQPSILYFLIMEFAEISLDYFTNCYSQWWHGYCIIYTNVSLLSAYISFHKFHIICLSEINLSSTIPSDDGNLTIHRYDFIGEDHPSNSEQKGVCASYQDLLPLKVSDIKYLQESILFELRVSDKCCKFMFL